MTTSLPQVTLFGAGCIGCYLGAALFPAFSAYPHQLRLVGRPALADAVRQNGLKISDYLGLEQHITDTINLVSGPKAEQLQDADILLITLKCHSVADNIEEMASYIDNNTLIICLQNGIGSEQAVTAAFPQNQVLTGIVGFNSLALSPTHFHRGTQGSVDIQAGDHPALAKLMHIFKQQALPAKLVDNITNVRWGKLLLNLNNCINALSNLPLKQQLSARGYRQILAMAMSETLKVLAKANISPTRMTALPPFLVPCVLSLPDGLFKLVANKMLAIDPLARSSMWHDITKQAVTEIDFINGAVVELALSVDTPAPVNKQLVNLIRQTEMDAQGSPGLSAEQLAQAISLL